MIDATLKTELVQPPPQLAPFVRTYWTMEGPYVDCHIQHIVPNGCAGIIFYRSGDVSFREVGQSLATLAGPTMSTIDLTRRGKSEMIGVQFSEIGFRILFGIPVSHVSGQILPLDIIGDVGLTVLQDRVMNAPDLDAGIDIINAFLMDRLSRSRYDDYNLRRIASSLAVINAFSSKCSTTDAAAASCLSAKQLLRIYKEYVGLTPSDLIRIKRCNGVIRDLRNGAGGNTSLSEVCARNGYYDLSHLSRELNHICGASARNILCSIRTEIGNYSWGLERAQCPNEAKSARKEKNGSDIAF